MGFYLETPENRNKTKQLLKMYPNAKKVTRPNAFGEVPPDQFLICVVSNGAFDACLVVYNQREFDAASDPSDDRPKSWLLLDRPSAYERLPKLKERMRREGLAL